VAAIEEGLAANPVIATLFGREAVGRFATGPTPFCFVGNVPLAALEHTVGAVRATGSFAFLNIDSVPGLAGNPDALEYLRGLGVPGVVSTHGLVVARAPEFGMLAVQKVFITDRSNLARAEASVAQHRPHLVQLMPWPVIPRLGRPFLDALPPFIASGFVTGPRDIDQALALGASAVTTSQGDLWHTHNPRKGPA
jgi:glycerol uptake operon antiterminator